MQFTSNNEVDRTKRTSAVANPLLETLRLQKDPLAANHSALDVYTAMRPGSSFRQPDSHAAYRALVSRLNPGQGAFDAYVGRVAFYHLLSEPSTQHLALALGVLFHCGMGAAVIGDHRVFETYGFPYLAAQAFARQDMLGNSPFYTIGLLERGDLNQADIAASLAHETVHILLMHLCGSQDPAQLVTQTRLLYSLAPAEQEALDRSIYADWLATTAAQMSPEEEETLFKAQQMSGQLAALRMQQICDFRALMLKHSSPLRGKEELERKAPNFVTFYIKQLDKDVNEFDAIVANDLTNLTNQVDASKTVKAFVEMIELAIKSPVYHPLGYSDQDACARRIVREEIIARFMQGHIGLKGEELVQLLPGIHAWYDQHIRPAVERFAGCAGIPGSEGESAISLLARRYAKQKPENDDDLKKRLFTPESLKDAYDPFAALYDAARRGDVKQAQSESLSTVRPGDNGACSPILAAIGGRHLEMIDWLMVKEPYFRTMPETVSSAAAASDEVLAAVMRHATDTTLGLALFQAGERVDQPKDAVARLLQYLVAHPSNELSTYIYGMAAAATYEYWDAVATFLETKVVVGSKHADLRMDEDVLRRVAERANRYDMNSHIVQGLNALINCVEGDSDSDDDA